MVPLSAPTRARRFNRVLAPLAFAAFTASLLIPGTPATAATTPASALSATVAGNASADGALAQVLVPTLEAEQAGRFTVRVYGSADVYTLGYVITAPTGTRFASTDRNWETSDGTSSTVPNGVVLSADGKTLTYGGMTYFPRYTASWTEESYELLSDGTAGDRAVNDGSFRITDGPDSLIGASIAIGYEAK